MLKNAHHRLFSAGSFKEGGLEGRNPFLDWLLSAGTVSSYEEIQYDKGLNLLKERSLSDAFFNASLSPQEGIAKIKDPLWARICENIYRILGPEAFGELWKTNFVSVSPEGKVAYLVCPSASIAETIENYHFVVMGALKEFYPSLSLLETEIKVA